MNLGDGMRRAEEKYFRGEGRMSKNARHDEFREKTQQSLQEAVTQGRPRRQIIESLTRRTFLGASPMTAVGSGLGLLAVAGMAQDALAQSSGVDSITSNFNGTAIPAGDWIWFTAVLKVHGLGSSPVTIGFSGSIQFSVNGTLYYLPVPSALVTFSPNVTVATTVFASGQWVTTVPISGLAGNVFLDGFALQAPAGGFPGGINPVTWQGMFFSLTPGITVQWQWAAAVYNNVSFGLDYTQLGVKPVDDNKASMYQDSDHAGTPENFTPYVIGGARGGGGSNFTGSYSATGSVIPAPACTSASCGGC
jgi:hypothetical protein